MKKVTILFAVLALVAVLSASGSEARHWGICKGAVISAWGACRGDPSGAECCSAVGVAAEQCPRYFSWGWLGRASARCEAHNTPIARPPPPPAPTPPHSPGTSQPNISCNIFSVAHDCGNQMNAFWEGAPTISAGCCKGIIKLHDDCHDTLKLDVYWDHCYDYCVDHQ